MPASGIGASIQGANWEDWGKVVADEGKVWRLESGRTAKKETEGTRWFWASPEAIAKSGGYPTGESEKGEVNGIGGQIRGAEGDVWGTVVADGGKVWKLESGRTAKKETEGTKWFWISAAENDSPSSDELLSLEIKFVSGGAVTIDMAASSTVASVAAQLKKDQGLAFEPQLLVGESILERKKRIGSAGSLCWNAIIVKPKPLLSRWRDHGVEWREIRIPSFAPCSGVNASPIDAADERLLLSTPTTDSRYTGVEEFWFVGANEKSGALDTRAEPKPPYTGVRRLPLPLPAGTKLRFHDFDGDTLTALLDDPTKGDKRTDPQDGMEYTFDELSKFYKGQYSKKELSDYWKYTCRPAEMVSMLKFRLCFAHEEDMARACWERQGAAQRVSFYYGQEETFRNAQETGYKAKSGFRAEPIPNTGPPCPPTDNPGFTIYDDSDKEVGRLDVRFHANHPDMAVDSELLLVSDNMAGEDMFSGPMRLFDWHTGGLVKEVPLGFERGYIECGDPRGILSGDSQIFFTAYGAEEGDDADETIVAFGMPA